MPPMRYKIWQWGEECKKGSYEAFNVGLTTRAKHGDADSPFMVANEMIALRLGRILGLPIPDGVIIERDGEPFFASMNINLEGFNLPPADASAVTRELGDLACGVIVFDIWIVNKDRHEFNLHYDNTKKAIYLIGQGACLYENEGFVRLLKNKDSIGIGPHCLASTITSVKPAREWVNKIAQIPRYVIRDIIVEAAHLGVPVDDIKEYVDFLVER